VIIAAIQDGLAGLQLSAANCLLWYTAVERNCDWWQCQAFC